MEGYSPRLPLQKDSVDGLYTMHKTSLETIKQDLKCLLLTNPGERMMIPDYGVGLRRMLFSQNSDNLKGLIANRVEEQVRKFMNFINVENIEILDVESNENALFVNIIFSIPSLNKQEQLNLEF